MRHQVSRVTLIARLSEITEAVIRVPGFLILLLLCYILLLIRTALLYASVHAWYFILKDGSSRKKLGLK